MRKFMHFMSGMVTGGILGSALVMLFTPVSGSETRDKISGYFNNMVDQVKQASQQKREELEEQLSALRSGKEIEP